MVFRPREGLSPTRPQQEAGARMDPKPSEPCAMGSMRAPTEAAAPPEDPPEMRAVSHGLLVGPWSCGSQVSESPSSQVLVRPKMTSPARLRRLTCSLSAGAGGGFAENIEPPGLGAPPPAGGRALRRRGPPPNGAAGSPSAR